MKRLLIVSLIVFVVALSVHAQKVSVGADPAVDVAKYKTYAWAKQPPSTNPIVTQTVVSAVDTELTAKGLQKVETDPELIVVAFGSQQTDAQVSNPSWAPSLNSIQTGVAVNSQSWLVTKGTLVVDISDAKTKNNVWRGTATQTLNEGPTGDRVKDAKNVAKPIQKAVKKMFKQYPHPSRK
jgi:hypothetical protein